jgi:FKBP-type peptidyl-prolyl cis-trans isomerase FklB
MKHPLFALLLMSSALLSHQPLYAQPMDSLSYSLGILMGQNLKNQDFSEADVDGIARGIKHVLKDEALEIEMDEANQIVARYVKQRREAKFAEVIAEGEAFLKANAKRPEVKTTESGLQYEILKEGKGASPTEQDRVRVHYHGTLLDGSVFDSSVERGEPATFGVTQVIPGWTEALKLMQVGDKWKIYLPYSLAYGSRGAGSKIGPYNTLIFEVELLGIE